MFRRNLKPCASLRLIVEMNPNFSMCPCTVKLGHRYDHHTHATPYSNVERETPTRYTADEALESAKLEVNDAKIQIAYAWFERQFGRRREYHQANALMRLFLFPREKKEEPAQEE